MLSPFDIVPQRHWFRACDYTSKPTISYNLMESIYEIHNDIFDNVTIQRFKSKINYCNAIYYVFIAHLKRGPLRKRLGNGKSTVVRMYVRPSLILVRPFIHDTLLGDAPGGSLTKYATRFLDPVNDQGHQNHLWPRNFLLINETLSICLSKKVATNIIFFEWKMLNEKQWFCGCF